MAFIPRLTYLRAFSLLLPWNKVKLVVFAFFVGFEIHRKTNIYFTLGTPQFKTTKWWLKKSAEQQSRFLTLCISTQFTFDELWLAQPFEQQTTWLQHGVASNNASITSSDIIGFALMCVLQFIALMSQLSVCKLWVCSRASYCRE